MSALIKLMARCSSCRKVSEMSAEQVIEARDIGCAFSACCQAVATVERVAVTAARESRKQAKRKSADAKYLQPGWQLPKVQS